MGPMCIPVYDIMERLEGDYDNVAFRDMAFDSNISNVVRVLPEVRNIQSLPIVVYYKKGKVAKVTGGRQSKQQVAAQLEALVGQN